MIDLIFDGFVQNTIDTTVAILPIIVLFILLNVFSFKLPQRETKKILAGFAITLVGLILFMHGVSLAFIPVGDYLGQQIGLLDYNFIIIPIGFVIGFVVAFAEPAVRVMNNQVEEMTDGSIKANHMLIAVSIGLAVSVAASLARILLGFSLWYFIIPGYLISFVLAKFVEPKFVAIAFDSGGVATGPLSSTFIMPLAIGLSTVTEGSDPLRDGFGMITLIALAPILSVLVFGFIYSLLEKRNNAQGGTEENGINK